MGLRLLDYGIEWIVKFFVFLKKIVLAVVNSILSKFFDISLPEKIIFINTVPAFFAIILSVARFHIFEENYYISNPLAVYMIGIVIFMFISLYFSGIIKFIIRLLINGYYLFWVIYIPLSEGLTKAEPHEITPGYYLNIAVPAVYIAASVFTFLSNKGE
ncbi:MAG: hypothetical protein JW864_11850 [Spirochaetes bacterium]|nr:hypothetical protein [Spirochaetota bacterium]